MTFSEEIKMARMEKGLTQRQMAKFIGISFSTYRNLENYGGGFRGTMPSMATVAKLRKKGVLDCGYAEVVKSIERDRLYKIRYSKGNRYNK
jgi:transcriptional regulator with XRE-family HTH domain